MIDVERLARAIDDTPTFVNWRVDKGDRYEAVQVWAAAIAAAYEAPPLRFQGDPLYGNAKLLTEGWKSTEQETGVYVLERA